MNAVLTTEAVSKRFGAVTAVDGISLAIRENEFFALLGPSGCGKTTLLRMLAGFESLSGGRILLDGKDISPLPPNRRPLNLMFQSYALFPHMTARANIAYGLEMERLPRAEIAARVAAILAATQLESLADRKPDALSGGQKQRVALARALVKRPRVLLLDEPLGALDKKLRGAMQLELKRLQSEVGITFIVVTHDQEEALVMADRVAVLKDGRVRQCGSPHEVYERPADRFVADFIGVMNFLPGRATPDGVEVPGVGLVRGTPPAGLSAGAAAVAAVRPERLSLVAAGAPAPDNRITGTVAAMAYHGLDVQLHVACDALPAPILVRLTADAAEAAPLAPGTPVTLGWAAADSRIFAERDTSEEPTR